MVGWGRWSCINPACCFSCPWAATLCTWVWGQPWALCSNAWGPGKREFQSLYQGNTDHCPKNLLLFGAERARVSPRAAGRKSFIQSVREIPENWISSSLFFILLNFTFHAVFEQQALAFPLTVMTHLRRTAAKGRYKCLSGMGKTAPSKYPSTPLALGTSYSTTNTEAVKVGKTFCYAALVFCLLQSICFSLVSLISIIYGFKDTISCRCGRNRTTNSKLIAPSVFWLKCPFQRGKHNTSPSPCTDVLHS